MELIPHNLSINFLKHKNTFIVGSIVLNLLIILGAAIFGLEWGVDFKGGAELEVQVDQRRMARGRAESPLEGATAQAGLLPGNRERVGTVEAAGQFALGAQDGGIAVVSWCDEAGAGL